MYSYVSGDDVCEVNSMKTNERVVVVKGDASKLYSQVVFFMNPKITENKAPIDFVAEAENIIYAYMDKKHKPFAASGIADYYQPPAFLPVVDQRVKPREKKRFRFDFPLYVLMAAACVALSAIIAFRLLT